MTGIYLLDTNAAIAALNGSADIEVLLVGAEVYLSSIVVGELYYGAEKSGRVAENIRRTEAFVSQRVVLNCDSGTARHFGHIRNQLKVKGRPIPINDCWIAATAIQHSLTLLTRDQHFNVVDGLAVQGW